MQVTMIYMYQELMMIITTLYITRVLSLNESRSGYNTFDKIPAKLRMTQECSLMQQHQAGSLLVLNFLIQIKPVSMGIFSPSIKMVS